MAFEQERQVYGGGVAVDRREFDEGLRRHMLRVYNYMTAALAITGVVALVVSQTPALLAMVLQLSPEGYIIGTTPLFWILAFLPLAFYLFMYLGLDRMSYTTVFLAFFAFAAAMGLSMAFLFTIYTPVSITRVFFITAGMFLGTSLWGYTTKKDLTGMGSFLMMGLIGLIIAMIVGIFMPGGMLYFIISVVGVVIFAGLAAYDTQKIKESYAEQHSHETAGKLAVMGAAELYWDFIMMFRFLLMLLGNRD